MLEIDNLVKCYGKTEVLHSISYKSDDNSPIGIIGSNGAGKTTLCMVINGLTTITSGDVIVNSHSLQKEPDMVKKITGIYNDKLLLYENMTVKECIKYYMELYYVRDTSYNKLVDFFNIYKFERKKIRELSTGMKKKVSLLISIMNKPEVLFLDEPFSGLDPSARVEFTNIIKELIQRPNMQIVISSHDLYELNNIVEQLIIMDKGYIIESGDTRHLINKYFDEHNIHITFKSKKSPFLSKYYCASLGDEHYETSISSNLLYEFMYDFGQDIQIININTKTYSLEDLYGKVKENETIMGNDKKRKQSII